ncbi:SusD/RagB family nutrient-binding outer membrane lipoprotein [Porphyromonas levii]|uniref:SusD/RagB family nutrient-binding outer membrane lipoprotein n=1 Tax=Porphyromonas levii TaxID=28114 RepID=UPI0003662B49|nr:SusD/RagB family nutrient-binding outer membrane lipoprotein [Porphyromonas levii]MBR8729786.1 hypothetical protein [Porphyromonas levii]MBR8764266.1 hypothetical protein [Porphyromonas levii]MBR8806898.1 hypothetical protein [Porphyromonas levii]
MKYTKLTTVALVAAMGMVSLSSCTKNFQEINTNPLLPNDEMLSRDGVLNGAYMPELQKQIIPTAIAGGTDQANDYQVAYNLMTDSWVGYMAPKDAKWSGRNLTQFYFDTGWTNGSFSLGTVKVFVPWTQIKKLVHDGVNKNLQIWSIAQISKILAIHRTTDRYGAIPYSSVGKGSFVVAYDSQKDIYNSFFKELDEAVNALYTFSLNTPVVQRASDIIYEGDALKWAKLGNSLMLRLAMRVRYVDPQLSRTWAEKAMIHSAGLIETTDQIALLSNKGGIATHNSLHIVANSYDDTRMGASIYSFMSGYKDPRLSKYFTGDLTFAVPPAIPASAGAYKNAAKPLVEEFSPTYIFKASEVAFLKAEAALYGYNTNGGTAKSHYENGIRLSFIENGIAESEVAAYLSGSKLPATFTDKANPKYSAEPTSKVTTAWVESDEDEVKLEKIITQKYLAIYPDGQEAWSEWRRTGYPRLLPSHTTISNFGVKVSDGHKDGVRCLPYPQSELVNNATYLQDAVNKYRDGNNSAVVNVWWDVKKKN